MSVVEVTRSPRSALTGPLACGCGLAAAAVYVAAVDPTTGGAFLPCPFRSITGWWCPGCGLTRATHFLLNGDITTALRYHAFVIPVLLAITWSWASWLARSAGRPVPSRRLGTRAAVSLAAFALLFALTRNLPWVHGLRG